MHLFIFCPLRFENEGQHILHSATKQNLKEIQQPHAIGWADITCIFKQSNVLIATMSTNLFYRLIYIPWQIYAFELMLLSLHRADRHASQFSLCCFFPLISLSFPRLSTSPLNWGCSWHLSLPVDLSTVCLPVPSESWHETEIKMLFFPFFDEYLLEMVSRACRVLILSIGINYSICLYCCYLLITVILWVAGCRKREIFV